MNKKIIDFETNYDAKKYAEAVGAMKYAKAFTEIYENGLVNTFFAMLGYIADKIAKRDIVTGKAFISCDNDNLAKVAEAIKEPPENIEAVIDIIENHELFVIAPGGSIFLYPMFFPLSLH